MRILRFPLLLLSSALVLAAGAAQALSVSGSTDALGITWTLTATDEVDAAWASDYEVMFSVTAEIPSDLGLIMDEGETISPTWITTAEASIAGLEEFRLVSAPGGVDGWLDLAGPSANGCRDTNGNFACAQAISDSDAAAITSGATHTWTWVGNVRDLDAVFAEDLSGLQHVGAQLQNARHRRGWMVSEEFTSPIPEPSAALVFGVGLLVAATGGGIGRRAR